MAPSPANYSCGDPLFADAKGKSPEFLFLSSDTALQWRTKPLPLRRRRLSPTAPTPSAACARLRIAFGRPSRSCSVASSAPPLAFPRTTRRVTTPATSRASPTPLVISARASFSPTASASASASSSAPSSSPAASPILRSSILRYRCWFCG